MSLVRICFGNSWYITDEDRPLARTIFPSIPESEKYFSTPPDAIIDINDVPDWVCDKPWLSIKPLKTLKIIKDDGIPDINRIGLGGARGFLKTVNQLVMPGYELLRYAAIQVLDDACTNQIQEELDKGWRIIAVIPQANNRRTDYIMLREQKPMD